ncbi:MAG TPA: pyridoxal-phosphate dependent enzyme [Micromonosporaceae bacterium]|nr:pyridoxal-phosphate dependent enzyme [Micromonosporaceae bacterium]
MTLPASTLRCAGCDYVAGPEDPYPFRCPRVGTDDADHVLTRVLGPEVTHFPCGGEDNPFLRYRALLHPYHVAMARGVSDARYRGLVASLDAAVAAVDGHGFRVTPYFRSDELSGSLGFSAAGGVWVKDETGNVSGSHKARHLMGVLIHLAVMEEVGLLDAGDRRGLAIASCGNAALAAAVVARAGGWRLTAFVPPDADPGVVSRLRELAADVVVCPRQRGTLGDPTYLRLREELAGGALPFTTQGNENGLAIEGGETLGYELAAGLAELPGGLDHLVIQVGGGALASSCIQALREAAQLGALDRLPRIHTVQTLAVHPLERAYARVRALLPDQPGADAVSLDRPDRSGGLDAVRRAVAEAAAHRSAFMQAWEEEPKSVATGILDDETYDWRAVVEGMLSTGGRPLVVGEELLVEANRLAVSRTGIRVDHTGSSGLAGLLQLRHSGAVGAHHRVAVLFTGAQR